MSNPQTSQGTTTTQQAPSWQLPYQQFGANQALAQFQGVNSPTQLVAPFSSQQNQAISNIGNIAQTGTPGASAAGSYVNNVLNGNPANNPYLSSEFNLAANDVQNRLSSEFANSGRGVVGSMPVQADQLNNLATQLYGGAYNTGVQQQEQALSSVPSLGSNALDTQQALYNAGGAVQNLSQQYINAPQQFLQQYLNQANQGLGQSLTTTGQNNPLLAGLGGASLGGSVGSAIGSAISPSSSTAGQTGSNWGSLVGGLLGAFGG